METSNDEEEIMAKALDAAREDITAVTEFIGMMASALQSYELFPDQDSRESKIASLAILIDEMWGPTDRTSIIAGVAIIMIAEAGLKFAVAEKEWFKRATEEAREMIRQRQAG